MISWYRSILGVRAILFTLKYFLFSFLNKYRVVVCWVLLLSKSFFHSQNVLILEVDVHLSHINQLVEFQCHIISINEVIMEFLYSFWYKKFKLNFEGLQVPRWGSKTQQMGTGAYLSLLIRSCPFQKVELIIENQSNGLWVMASQIWAAKNVQNKIQRCILLNLYVFLGSIGSRY